MYNSLQNVVQNELITLDSVYKIWIRRLMHKVYHVVRFILNSSQKLCVGRHLRCKELWDHPLNGNIQILPQLDSISPGIEVGSSMIPGSQIASFSPRHRLRDSPLGHPSLLKMLDLLHIVPFWCQVDENPLLCWFERSLESKLFEFWRVYRMWMACVDSKFLNAWIFIDKRYVAKPLPWRIIGEGGNRVMGPTERQGNMVLSHESAYHVIVVKITVSLFL